MSVWHCLGSRTVQEALIRLTFSQFKSLAMVVQELITCSLIDKFVHFVMVPFVRAKVDLQGYRLSLPPLTVHCWLIKCDSFYYRSCGFGSSTEPCHKGRLAGGWGP